MQKRRLGYNAAAGMTNSMEKAAARSVRHKRDDVYVRAHKLTEEDLCHKSRSNVGTGLDAREEKPFDSATSRRRSSSDGTEACTISEPERQRGTGSCRKVCRALDA